MASEQLHVFYSGQVQGVGFRYHTRRIAQSLKIKGWVKNLPDGRVEILALSPLKSTLNSFLDKIESTFTGYIRGKQVSWGQDECSFGGFTIDF